ncbi:MAG: hypothetical protein QOF64_399 [Candidatus Binatota bacterium]|jgi:hypothetical protein|nr:hypothetical protein [Candidatus Binatota bacterium]
MQKDLLGALDRVRARRKMATLLNAAVAFCNKRRGSLAKLVFAAASLIVIVSAVAQEFRYNFNDQPYPEANVIVISHKLVPRESSQWFLEGRVFNRGLKTAKNVRVVYSMIRSGANMPGNPIYLSPSDIPPTSSATFRERLPQISDPRDVFITVNAEWDN